MPIPTPETMRPGTTQWPLLDVAAGALATYTVHAIDHSTIQDLTVPEGAL